MQRLHTEFTPLAQGRELAMRLHLPRIPAWVHSDEMLLSRIISNILSNAKQYGARTGILLAVRSRESHWSIEVWDTGAGIAEADQRRIFSEFYQVGNPERDRSHGLGLGLAIVERLVTLLKLKLAMRSQLGRGTMFRILVPKFDAPDTRLVGTDTASANIDLTGLFVLVIDNEAAICEAMAALLKQWDCRTMQAGSGLQMKNLLAYERRIPDLIICDYRLRGDENGIDVIEALRGEYNQNIPGLIVTGDTLPERLKQAAASGLPIAHKPLSPTRLRELVQSSQRPVG